MDEFEGLEGLTDGELLAALKAHGGVKNDPFGRALAAEIARRNLSI